MLRPPFNLPIRDFIRSHKHLLALAKAYKRTVHPEKHNWHVISFDDVFGLAVDWANLLPKNFDCIIGVPRSGLLIANVLATKMNKPLSTPEDFIRGIVWQSKDSVKPSEYLRVLVVEDAVASARAFERGDLEITAI